MKKTLIVIDMQNDFIDMALGKAEAVDIVPNTLIIKATFPEAVVKVDSACCAGVTVESHEAALKTMHMCQVEVI